MDKDSNSREIVIYTDGACSGNPGPGGWGAVLFYGDNKKELSGYEPLTTNQRMEITAVLQALKALKVTGWKVTVYSDSAYVVNAFQQNWIKNWQKNGWKNSKKEPVANQELWRELVEQCEKNYLNLQKVKGHAGQEWNERCDELARKAIKDNR